MKRVSYIISEENLQKMSIGDRHVCINDGVMKERIDIDLKDWNSFVEIINKISKLLVLK